MKIVVSAYHKLDKEFELIDGKIIILKGFNQWNKRISDIEENLGTNFYTYFKYICNNYNELEGLYFFTKSNIFSRHIEYNEAIDLISRNNHINLLPVFSRKINLNNKVSHIKDNFYYEIKNDWSRNRYPSVTNLSLDGFWMKYFEIKAPNFFKFSPGGNFIVDATIIKRKPVEYYRSLYSMLGMSEWPLEGQYVERAICEIFSI